MKTSAEKLAEACEKVEGLRTTWMETRCKTLRRAIGNELEFWLNKKAMLDVMVKRGIE